MLILQGPPDGLVIWPSRRKQMLTKNFSFVSIPFFFSLFRFRAAWSDCDCDAPQSGAVERFWCSSSRGASISRRSRADRPPWAGRSKNRARPVALGGWMV